MKAAGFRLIARITIEVINHLSSRIYNRLLSEVLRRYYWFDINNNKVISYKTLKSLLELNAHQYRIRSCDFSRHRELILSDIVIQYFLNNPHHEMEDRFEGLSSMFMVVKIDSGVIAGLWKNAYLKLKKIKREQTISHL